MWGTSLRPPYFRLVKYYNSPRMVYFGVIPILMGACEHQPLSSGRSPGLASLRFLQATTWSSPALPGLAGAPSAAPGRKIAGSPRVRMSGTLLRQQDAATSFFCFCFSDSTSHPKRPKTKPGVFLSFACERNPFVGTDSRSCKRRWMGTWALR